MTYLVANRGPKHVVVDGSNLATEGRTSPSLKQLHEAVLSFMNEYPDTKVTVVVDATFGHRIDKREVAEFNDAIDNNELVSPPAGAGSRSRLPKHEVDRRADAKSGPRSRCHCGLASRNLKGSAGRKEAEASPL